MTPPQVKYTNGIQSMYCAFSEYHESVQHTVWQARHDLRSMRLTGVVWNTDAEAFLHKAIELEVYTKDDDWAEWAERMHGRTDICGDITIAANVERADYSPIRISVGVTLDLWRDFQQVARSAIDAGFHVEAVCGFWSPGEKQYGLDKLDISNESTYPLHSFDMRRSPQRLKSSSAEPP
jgi:hypothetical protein